MGHSLSAALRTPFIKGLYRSVPNDESQHLRYAPALAVLRLRLNTIHAQQTA